MTVRRHRAAALASVCATAMTAVSASGAGAANLPIVGGGSFARTIPFIDGDIYLFECHAAAPGAVTTTVEVCGFGGIRGVPSTTSSGPLNTATGNIVEDPFPHTLCWTVSAVYGDGSTQRTSGCTNSSAIGGAG